MNRYNHMSDQTLYFIQSEFAKTNDILNQLEQMANLNDSIVLFADAVLFAQDQRLIIYPHLYVLEQDAELNPMPLPSHIQQLNYDGLTNLVLNFTRSISLK